MPGLDELPDCPDIVELIDSARDRVKGYGGGSHCGSPNIDLYVADCRCIRSMKRGGMLDKCLCSSQPDLHEGCNAALECWRVRVLVDQLPGGAVLWPLALVSKQLCKLLCLDNTRVKVEDDGSRAGRIVPRFSRRSSQIAASSLGETRSEVETHLRSAGPRYMLAPKEAGHLECLPMVYHRAVLLTQPDRSQEQASING